MNLSIVAALFMIIVSCNQVIGALILDVSTTKNGVVPAEDDLAALRAVDDTPVSHEGRWCWNCREDRGDEEKCATCGNLTETRNYCTA
ncbi:hypothetical protein DFH28DRAFT_25404 [Melampsora americana]|nr:hypothetical protein DFH28DRAFT_25404 [Melampsora americana]